jgi:hypothetical protein
MRHTSKIEMALRAADRIDAVSLSGLKIGGLSDGF